MKIDEDKNSDYELRMLQRWIDRDANFRGSVPGDLAQLGNVNGLDSLASVPL